VVAALVRRLPAVLRRHPVGHAGDAVQGELLKLGHRIGASTISTVSSRTLGVAV
jgi:hypothetical protein